MKTIDCIESSTTQKPEPAPKIGEPIKLQSNGKPSSSESVTGKLPRKLQNSLEQNNCLLCEVVLPEYEDMIIRLKLKIQLFEQIIKEYWKVR